VRLERKFEKRGLKLAFLGAWPAIYQNMAFSDMGDSLLVPLVLAAAQERR
jgi:hypothetical protein